MAATRIGQLAAEIAQANPWWRTADWQASDIDLKPVKDRSLNYRPDCLANLEPSGLYLLRGPRRVGKTVAVKQAIETLVAAGTPPRSIVRVAADGWDAKDIRTMVQNISIPPVAPAVKRYWFIDEITAVAGDWATQIKWLRDNNSEFKQATVVLTGSNSEQLSTAAGTLAGRRGDIAATLDRTLLPMGFRTFARTLDPALPDIPRLPLSELFNSSATATYQELIPWLDILIRLWEIYLGYGGFPLAVAAARDGQSVPNAFLEDLFNVIARDAFGTSRMSHSTVMALIERVMEGITSPFNASKVAADLGISNQSVARHLESLRNSYLIWSCPLKNESSWTAREKAQEKLYGIDPLIARLAHLRNPHRRDIDPTALAEMQVGMAIRRGVRAGRQSWESDNYLFFARTRSRKEIDFVSEMLAGTAIEVKYTDSGTWVGGATALNLSEWTGILATRSVLDNTQKKIWAVPAAMLGYLVDS